LEQTTFSVYGSNESTCRDNAQKKIICARTRWTFERELDLRCDVHYTHYGRLCPIETPERTKHWFDSLGVYAKVNGMVSLKHLTKVTNGVVDLVSTPIYLSAEEEEGMLISKNIQMDKKLLPKT
jgi:DNA-directed RNA polymerase beta subunit